MGCRSQGDKSLLGLKSFVIFKTKRLTNKAKCKYNSYETSIAINVECSIYVSIQNFVVDHITCLKLWNCVGTSAMK